MCLAIYKPEQAIIPKHHLENGYEHNDDGCGFCYSENNKLFIVKGLFSFNEFYTKYKEKEHLAMLIHFRFATHGSKNVLNCHPFPMCNGKYALIHNGVLPIDCSIRELSDTGNWAKLVMEPMLHAGISPGKSSFHYLVEEAIGRSNKICVMDNTGNVTIYNPQAGDYEDAKDKNDNQLYYSGENGKKYKVEVWYSNSGYKYGVRRRRVIIHPDDEGSDEYAGYYDGGCSVGTAELSSGVVVGFKEGIKSAKESGEIIKNIYDSKKTPLNADRDGKYPVEPNKKKETIKIKLPQNLINVSTESAPIPVVSTTVDDNTAEEDNVITDIKYGPVFDVKEELEISFLISEMKLSREDAIKKLELKTEEAKLVIN